MILKYVKRVSILFLFVGLFSISGGNVLALTIDTSGNLTLDTDTPYSDYRYLIYEGAGTVPNYNMTLSQYAVYGGTVLSTVQSTYDHMGGSWVPYVDVSNWYYVDLAGFASCGYQPDNRACIEGIALDSGTFVLANIPPPPPPPPAFVPLSFKFIATSSDLLASVGGSITDGVKETGKNIWPMFVFLGIPIVFIIAMQLLVFTKNTIGTTRSGNSYPSDLPKEDRRAYRRGKRLIEKDHPDFYKD